ncbi:hypothetical protein VTK73DRAFT_10012 [Phialemonium thermophilum]|uniref:Endothelin-converting enzyme 1 n=1 Tax=Phialemonium thermophilum TaxID=223376 RepID=A0ABR3Y455_9PEZI
MTSRPDGDVAAGDLDSAGADGTLSERTPLLDRINQAYSSVHDGESASSHHTRNRKIWVTFVALLFILLLSFLTVVFGVFRHQKMVASRSLCLTPACIHAASEILYNLSPHYETVDPCTEFDKLVCDGWRARHDMRPDQGSISVFTTMAETGQRVLRHILEGSYPGGSNHSSFSPFRLAATENRFDEDNFDTIQRAYNACMAESQIAAVGIRPVQNLLDDLSSAVSPGHAASSAGTGISGALLYLERLGIPSFLEIGVGPDDKDPDSVITFLSPRPGIGLPSKTYYLDNDTVEQYKSAMSDVLSAVLTGRQGHVDVANLANEIVDLEARIAAVTPALEDLQDVTKAYNPMDLTSTADLVPVLGLEYVLKSLAPSDYTMDKLISSFPEFLGNLSDILAVTSNDTIQAFLSWKVIQAASDSVVAPEVKPYIQFMNRLSGKEPDASPERWRVCIQHVDRGLGWILSRFYVEAASSEAAKDLGNQIVSDIREQFISRIKTLDWMDAQVKDLAISKVNAIIKKIAYPDKSPNVTDPGSLKDYYSGLNVTTHFFNNHLSFSRWTVNQTWEQLGKPTNRDSWGMTAPTVNAYYNPAGNEIVFPAGIMQFPAFESELPKYINYGAFGAVAGHELSHAFDNNGRHYDVRGNLTDWWTNSTVQAFNTRTDCFVQEYSKFIATGPNGTVLHINGRQTLGENIADAGGLTAAFNVWKRRQEESPDLDLPGLQFFTQEQLFYISYGGFWCSKYSRPALARAIYTDEHSPAFARVEGAAMLNSRGFREAFHCPVKEPVCELW